MMAAPTTSAERRSPFGPLGIDDQPRQLGLELRQGNGFAFLADDAHVRRTTRDKRFGLRHDLQDLYAGHRYPLAVRVIFDGVWHLPHSHASRQAYRNDRGA